MKLLLISIVLVTLTVFAQSAHESKAAKAGVEEKHTKTQKESGNAVKSEKSAKVDETKAAKTGVEEKAVKSAKGVKTRPITFREQPRRPIRTRTITFREITTRTITTRP